MHLKDKTDKKLLININLDLNVMLIEIKELLTDYNPYTFKKFFCLFLINIQLGKMTNKVIKLV